MHRNSVHEVTVRVESSPDFPAENGPSPRHLSRNDSVEFNIMSSHQISPRISGKECESQERKVCEDTNDAIWEEVESQMSVANLRTNSPPQQCSTSSRQASGHPRFSLERSMQREADASAELCRRDSEPRHRSLDLDIHINEANVVLLQDNLVACKPLCDHLGEKHFSLSSSAKPLPPQCFPVGPNPEEEEEEEAEGSHRRAREAASLSFENRGKLKDDLNVKPQISDGQANTPVKKLVEAGETSEASAALSSPGAVERKSARTVTLSAALGSPRAVERKSARTVTSKELVKTKTKSRLLPSNPSASAVASGRFSEAEKKGSLQSPVRPSTRTVEVEGEEDPFKGIDVEDTFRRGNLKAITVAQWVAFFVVMGCLICSVVVSGLKGRQLWGLELWKWFLLVLVVLCGRLVSGWLIRIVVIIFEMNFLLRKKVLYFVYGLRKGVQNCLWLGLVLLAWKLMFDPRVKSTTSNHKALLLVTRLLECFLIAAFIWLAKILLVKSLASSFHVTTFFDRIQESLFNQHVLEALSGPPLLDLAFEPLPFHGKGTTAATQKDQQTDANISVEDLQKMSTHNVSAGLMTRLMHLVRHPGLGTLVTTIDESVGVDQDSDDIEINSELEAKAAAMRIFKNVAQRDSMSIEREDLLRFVTSDEVPQVLYLFEGAKETGKITKNALKNWVVNVYQERKALAHSLNDTKTAVKELHRMASVVVIIIIIVVWLLILGIATTKVLVFFSSQLLLAGFMFSNTVKQVFEAIIFLFVMHPFDVGDRCIIDGIQMVVEEMKILSTVFLKADNEKVFYPNAVLATKPISNLYRSPEMKDFLDFSVHISTPADKITAFQEKISVYVGGKSEHWHPKVGVVVKELEDLNRMRLSVTVQHTINFQNFGEKMNRRSDLLLELKRIFAELKIEYRLLTQPVLLSYPSPPPSSQLLPLPVYSGPLM